MNPYYSVGKSSSLVLSASSIVTIRGKGDGKEEALPRAERRKEASETATCLLIKPSAFSVHTFAEFEDVRRTRRKPLVIAQRNVVATIHKRHNSPSSSCPCYSTEQRDPPLSPPPKPFRVVCILRQCIHQVVLPSLT